MRSGLMLLMAVAVCFVLAGSGSAQTTKTEKKANCFNPEKINWVFPGHFDRAYEQAEKKNRLLLIKGLGFGLDDLGATCATKGCW